jgi:Polyketide cyclase / dehydrase and lipid transport
MAGPYRRQGLVEAPVDEVWAVVSDPRTHPDWWPDVTDVRVPGPITEGGEYTRVLLGSASSTRWMNLGRRATGQPQRGPLPLHGVGRLYALCFDPSAGRDVHRDRSRDAAAESPVAPCSDLEQALLRSLAQGRPRRTSPRGRGAGATGIQSA